MGYEGVLQFKGTWRNYQTRVLKNADRYMKDGKVHIVAAPGSGKTTLGIELIRRIGRPALVLTPSVTIREQWVARIEEAFLCDGINPADYLSQNLKQPSMITVATYQALHSAMTRFAGALAEREEQDEDTDEKTTAEKKKEVVDFSDFDLISVVQNVGIGVLCLDECHHLRSEWWKALEDFKKEVTNLKTIALTATPPYDATPAMWTRYLNMCGEIDEEITIPELVREGSLCPHQDYIYFNYPTEDEERQAEQFRARSAAMMMHLLEDTQFASAIQTHGCLTGKAEEDKLLDNPSALAALLIFLQEKKLPFPVKLKRLLGAERLPAMNASWMEKLLQSFLYEDTDMYACDKEYREQLMTELKADGLIEKRKVCLTASDAVEKLLLRSKGKCSSIRDIVAEEYANLGKELRQLVLTDYIRKEYEKSLGVPETEINALGVLPFFEMLRREAASKNSGLRLGVLCGTIVVIPAEAKEALIQAAGGSGKVTFSSIGALPESDYLKVNAVGDAHFLTGVVTEIFKDGYMQVLIGTKSLLGEGWDSPCINSLILASFVGSFMLSNQMRGRAIRVFRDKPEKTSNIWHLVCLRPWKEAKNAEDGVISEDFELLERRMEHFLGLHYTEDTIENGMARFSVIKPPYDKENVNAINRQMLELSRQRSQLKERWQRSLDVYDKMDVVDETQVADAAVTSAVFRSTSQQAVICGVLAVVLAIVWLAVGRRGVTGTLAGVGAVVFLFRFLQQLPRLSVLRTPYHRLKSFGNGIRKAMLQKQLLESDKNKVVAEEISAGNHAVYLSGGSGREKALFTQCVKEFFSPLDNQRYILVKEKNHRGNDGFYCVPECFAKKKEDAERFVECMKPYIGAYELVYTRNERGRALLLEGRVRALANKEERIKTRKKVKGALE